jgi:hypothetical protein
VRREKFPTPTRSRTPIIRPSSPQPVAARVNCVEQFQINVRNLSPRYECSCSFRHHRKSLLTNSDAAVRRSLCRTVFTLCSVYSSLRIATDYGLDDRGLNPGRDWEFLSSTPCPHRLWNPYSLLSNGYQGLFPGDKAAGA